MPVGFLSDAERERLDGFPAQVVPGDIEPYFTLSRADRRQIPRTASPANRLGFALQLGALRFLGFCPDRDSPRGSATWGISGCSVSNARSDTPTWGLCSKGGSTATESCATGMTCCGWPGR